MRSTTPDTIVIGGGIIGLACAHRLALDGHQVTLLDGGPPRHPATRAAAGLLAPFSHRQPTTQMAQICIAARDLWDDWHAEICAQSEQAVEYDRSGALIAAATEDQLEVLAKVTATAEQLGEPTEQVSAEALREQIPDLRRDLAGGLLIPGEKRVDNVTFYRALTTAARKAGVKLESGQLVRRVARHRDGLEIITGGDCYATAHAILATGSWSSQVAGIGPLPVRPVRGQMIRVGGVDWPWQGMVRIGNYYGVRRGRDVIFGATVEEAGDADHTTPSGINSLLVAFNQAFPILAGHRLVDSWSGLRPVAADALPIIGQWRDWPLFIATGHHRDGILLAPWTAHQAAAWRAAPEAVNYLEDLSPDRFADRKTADLGRIIASAPQAVR